MICFMWPIVTVNLTGTTNERRDCESMASGRIPRRQNFVGQARRLPKPKASGALALQRHCGIVGTPRCDARSNVVYGWVAQLAEQWTENPRVGGSIPPPAIFLMRASRLWCEPFLTRSEEHTSELQSRSDLVCRLLL